ncbi:MAG TPA: hypothetical protein VFP65_18480 [Anaeromyxobacteraceae bacterium]|nr:hypothetical protein [Anaeromyxobacteraceae bacterium]
MTRYEVIHEVRGVGWVLAVRSLDTGDWIGLRTGFFAAAPTLDELVAQGIPVFATLEEARASLEDLSA